ncbi:GGDEF domain-containing protein [Vibrio parahaemolyticus]|nr:GGDEF domain-containing protein [Vibrio parahaemolyticus]
METKKIFFFFLSASKDLYQNHSVRALESSVLLVVIVVVLAVPLGLIVSYKPSKNAEMLSELMIEHQLYRDIVDQHVPIIDVNLKGNITRINAAMCNLSGFQEREVIGCSSSIFYHPDSEPKNLIDVWKKLSQGQSWSDEFHNLSKDGKTYWLHSNISPRYDPEGNKRGYIIVSSDITNRKRLQTISEMDSLTRLNNRSKLNRLLESEFNRAQRYLTPFVVLIVDIDRFKSVNDTYGHLVGDSVLIEVANILRYNVRQTDFVGRWGGEEFMIICPHSELDEGVVVAEKLCEAVNTFEFAEVRELSISIGVAVYENGCDIKSILEFADRNLYRAKSLGRNRVVSELGRYVCK